MSGFFSRLFGGGGSRTDAAAAPHEDYKGFLIRPEPIKESNGWRMAARIEKTVDGAVKTHHLIRADVMQDREAAVAASAAKSRSLIDEQGDTIFR